MTGERVTRGTFPPSDLCECGKPASHVLADEDSAEWGCRVPIGMEGGRLIYATTELSDPSATTRPHADPRETAAMTSTTAASSSNHTAADDVSAYERGEPVTHGTITVQQVDSEQVRVSIGDRTWVTGWDDLLAALDTADTMRATG